LLEYLDTVFNT